MGHTSCTNQEEGQYLRLVTREFRDWYVRHHDMDRQVDAERKRCEAQNHHEAHDEVVFLAENPDPTNIYMCISQRCEARESEGMHLCKKNN